MSTLDDFDEKWRLADELRDVVPILKLSEAERRDVVARMRRRTFAEGAVVYQLGDVGNDVFVVHHGLVKSVLQLASGREIRLGLYGHGQFFGLMQLFGRTPVRDSTVIATAPTLALQIPVADARRVLKQNFEAMMFVYQRMAQSTFRMQKFMATVLHRDVPGRVAWMLYQYAAVETPADFSQDEIADIVGASRRSVNAALADLARRGIVSVRPRAVRVVDRARLTAEVGELLGRDEDNLLLHADDLLFRE
ncbi:MAG TPA: Crp/Fnr family transcriptional regulator [Candidatus Acidoferrales bacterium]|nr:Crp/Fnr family transcriptional regulator [Candidatus Acidoferrales bacterium]